VSNAFLATKIAYTNEVANVCSALGIDVYEVMKGVGLDARISPHFLNAGVGFGGSCFPKDVAALQAVAKAQGAKSRILEAVLASNDDQPLRAVDLAEEVLGSLEGKRVALLGLAFKPDTDDVRYSRAFPIAEELLKRKAKVVAYDPKGTANFREAARTQKIKVEYARTVEEALRDADCAIVQSDWKEFRRLTPKQLKQWMRAPVIVDGRRTFDPEKLTKAGVVYRGIGWRNGAQRRFT
jgi:UDPglucose 6-dehydrogenase